MTTTNNKNPSGITKSIVFLLLLAVCVPMVIPFYWMVSTSLKDQMEVYAYPPKLIPETLNWDNYRVIMTDKNVPLFRFLFNSLFVAVSVTILQTISCAMGAYAFARLNFKGKNIIFLVYLGTMMVPFQIRITPLFILISRMKLVDTYWALILPSLFSAYGTFLLRQFFTSIPKSLEESVVIDGGGYWLRFVNIILPLSKPALATLCVFTFLYQWNDFLWPLLVTNTIKMKTLPVGLTFFMTQNTVYWNLLMAAATFAVIPMVIIYIFAQKYFVAGITLTGMKS